MNHHNYNNNNNTIIIVAVVVVVCYFILWKVWNHPLLEKEKEMSIGLMFPVLCVYFLVSFRSLFCIFVSIVFYIYSRKSRQKCFVFMFFTVEGDEPCWKCFNFKYNSKEALISNSIRTSTKKTSTPYT